MDLPFTEGDGITIDALNPGVKISWAGMVVNDSDGINDIEFNTDDFTVSVAGGVASVGWKGMAIDGKSGIKTLNLDTDWFHTTGTAPTLTIKWWGVEITGYAQADFSGDVKSTTFGFGDEFYIGIMTAGGLIVTPSKPMTFAESAIMPSGMRRQPSPAFSMRVRGKPSSWLVFWRICPSATNTINHQPHNRTPLQQWLKRHHLPSMKKN